MAKPLILIRWDKAQRVAFDDISRFFSEDSFLYLAKEGPGRPLVRLLQLEAGGLVIEERIDLAFRVIVSLLSELFGQLHRAAARFQWNVLAQPHVHLSAEVEHVNLRAHNRCSQ